MHGNEYFKFYPRVMDKIEITTRAQKTIDLWVFWKCINRKIKMNESNIETSLLYGIKSLK